MTSALTAPLRIVVEESSQVSPARALARQLAHDIGLDAHAVEQVALVATELAENLHRHAVGGELIVAPGSATTPGGRGLRIIAVDRGPGVERFDRCLVDGFTTAGTMGTGLGAVGRLSTFVDAVSEPGLGTVVLAGFAAGHDVSDFDVGALGFPILGEEVNGDSWAAVHRGSRLVVLVADGLGHGPQAAIASRAATAGIGDVAGPSPATMLAAVNRRLAGTRGAAVTLAALSVDAAREGGIVTTAGLGNVSVLLAGPDGASKRVATAHGTAGARVDARTTEESAPFAAGGVLILHTDGLLTRWTLEGRTELLRHRSEVIAAALWRDHARGTDDAQVVVAKAAGRAR